MPPPEWLDGLRWNWWGKGAALVLTLGILAMLPSPLRRQAGCQWPRAQGWRLTVAVTALGLCFTWGMAGLTAHGGHRPLTLETLCFQATLPGLQEELLYRGVALGLLIAAMGPIGKGRQFLGIQWHWGTVPLTLSFVGEHMVNGVGDTPLAHATIIGLSALLFLWVRERTGSVWPAVVVHNLMNVGSALVFHGVNS